MWHFPLTLLVVLTALSHYRVRCDYIHRSMADDVNTLAVAAVLQYFVTLVACRMLLITRKNAVENTGWKCGWQRELFLALITHCLMAYWVMTIWHLKMSCEWIFQHFQTCYLLWRKQWRCTGGVADPRQLLSDWLETKNHRGDHGLNEHWGIMAGILAGITVRGRCFTLPCEVW